MLVIAPHVDDAEFGVGGWLHRAQRKGIGTARVVVVAGGDYQRSDGTAVEWAQREHEARAGMLRLGIKNYELLNLMPENAGHTADYAKIVGAIERQIAAFEATEVFVPLPSFNQDHRLVHDACLTALRPGMFSRHLKHVWAYEYPGNAWASERPQWGRAYLGLGPEDITAKMDALGRHYSQFSGRRVAVGPEAAYAMLVQRGSEVGLDAAECVYLLREVYP